MYAYDPSEWSDLFVAVAGASAALAGLLFVAISINLDRIIGGEGLPERALEAVLVLVGVLVMAIIGLVPGQSRGVFGAELFVAAVALGFAVLRPIRVVPANGPRFYVPTRWGMRLAVTLPLIIGAGSVISGDGGGLYWVVAGMIFGVLAAVANAWVLLVEILR